MLKPVLIHSLLLLCSTSPVFSNEIEEAIIYRDVWGVPHIYADTQNAAAYAHGYVQAQDRLDDILTLYLIAQGKAASAFGRDWIKQDYESRIARHSKISQDRYSELEPESRLIIEYFIEGIKSYMGEHPEEIPEWADEPKPFHVVALYRSFIWKWPWSQALNELKQKGSNGRTNRGSNQWVVGPSRSAEGGPIALIDPHLSWGPEDRWYEAHVHGDSLGFFGFSIIGTPLMAVGHTNIFSLSLTLGGPDCADVYEEKINPENPAQYQYDSEWRNIQVEKVKIEVRTPQGLELEKLEIERTHHGPIIKRKNNRAYVVKTAYDNEIGIFDQWLRMLKSTNLGEFLIALSENHSIPVNMMYADVYGNTYYIRAGRVPIRPLGFHWNQPVQGWTSRSEWTGIHPLSDLVQILNPAPGYLQNCNVSPGSMMLKNSLKPDNYPDYIFNAQPKATNSRGRRALQLLSTNNQMSIQKALEIAVDTYVEQANLWQEALADAFNVHRTPFSHLNLAVQLLLDWNCRMDVDSPGASLFYFWMRAIRKKIREFQLRGLNKGNHLPAAPKRPY